MSRKFFGTDGIRGRVNDAPMTAEIAMRVGQAAGAHFLRGDHRHRVVIGKDTRLSGYMMESAMVAGFTSVGMDVVLLGPMPTPAVAMLTRSMRADLGVMISAATIVHRQRINCSPAGINFSDEASARSRILGGAKCKGLMVRPPKRIEDAWAIRHSQVAFRQLPSMAQDRRRFANGAGYQFAPDACVRAGADVIPLASPQLHQLNHPCGSTSLSASRSRGPAARTSAALDGTRTADVVDETGKLIDGQLMH